MTTRRKRRASRTDRTTGSCGGGQAATESSNASDPSATFSFPSSRQGLEDLARRTHDCVMEFVLRVTGTDLFRHAGNEYQVPGAELHVVHDFVVFAAWCLYHWRCDGDDTLAEFWLRSEARHANPDMVGYARLVAAAPFSLFEVLEADAPHGILIRDLATDGEMFVAEPQFAAAKPIGHVLFGKVVSTPSTGNAPAIAMFDPGHRVAHRPHRLPELEAMARRAYDPEVIEEHGSAARFIIRTHYAFILRASAVLQ